MMVAWVSFMCYSLIDDLIEYDVGYEHKTPCSRLTLSKQQETECSSKASLTIIDIMYRIYLPVEVRNIDRDLQNQVRPLVDERHQLAKGKVRALPLVISNFH